MFKSKLFIKYLTSYITVLLIPILILGTINYNSFVNILKKEVNNNCITTMMQSKDSIDSNFDQLNKFSIQLANNPYLTSSCLSESFSNVMTAIKLLKNFNSPNNFYRDFFIYYPDHEYIYSPSGTYTLDSIFNKIYKFENFDLNKLNEKIFKSSKPFMIYTSPQKYMTYVVPIPYGTSSPIGAVIFLIEENSINKLVKDFISTYNGNFYILDENYDLFQSSVHTNIDLNNLIKKEELKNNITAKKVKLNTSSYYLSSIKAENNYWTYITLIPASKITHQVDVLKNKFFISLLAVFIIGFLIVYFLMILNYKPLKELYKFTNKILGVNTEEVNEIASVKEAVNQMGKTIEHLQNKVEDYRPALKNSLLHKLLKGDFESIEDFNKEGKDLEISFSKNFFIISVFMFDNLKSTDIYSIMNIVEKLLYDEFEVYGLDNIDDNKIIFINCAKNYNDEAPHEKNSKYTLNYFTERLISIQSYLKEQLKLQATIGVGGNFCKCEEIPNSYLQAFTALDYRLIKGKYTIISYDEIKLNEKNINFYPKESLQLLDKYINQGDITKINEIINQIITNIKENKLPLIAAKSICYSIISSLTNYLKNPNNNFNFNKNSYPDIISLSKFETIEDLSIQIEKMCSSLFCGVNATKPSNKKQLEQILNYIQNNFEDLNFSTQIMAEEFNMSLSYMSHYFKAQTNENISDYVNRLRMDKAKKLLCETKDSLQDIALKVGYTNVSSFIRKFKQTTGITPGAYRDLNN